MSDLIQKYKIEYYNIFKLKQNWWSNKTHGILLKTKANIFYFEFVIIMFTVS